VIKVKSFHFYFKCIVLENILSKVLNSIFIYIVYFNYENTVIMPKFNYMFHKCAVTLPKVLKHFLTLVTLMLLLCQNFTEILYELFIIMPLCRPCVFKMLYPLFIVMELLYPFYAKILSL
jgi:hypothetical protein